MILLLAALIIPLGLDAFLPVPEENPLTPEKIEIGRRLFFDRRLSRDNSVSCSSCHDPKRAFSDAKPAAIGVFGRKGRRNTPAIINRAYGRSFFWDGRLSQLEDVVLKPIENPNEMDLSLEEASQRTGMIRSEMSRALASYVRSILSGGSPFDRFLNGQEDALTPGQKAGFRIFRGKGNCFACHNGPNFSDEKLHNTGIARRDGRFTDEGGGSGRFKTPTLREVSRTSPYMHNGSLTTLEDVIEYYDRGGNPNPALDVEIHELRLTSQERNQLLDFLQSLSTVSPRPE